MYPAFPDFERWLREQSRPDLAQRWRYRAESAQEIVGDRVDPPRPRDIRGFTPIVKDDVVHYVPRARRRGLVASVCGQGQCDPGERMARARRSAGGISAC